MKEMRRLLSFLLVLVMVVGFVPAQAFAAEVSADFTGGTAAATDYLFFGTDRHDDTDIIGKLLTNMESDIGNGMLDYVGLGGDMVDNTDKYNSSTVLAEVTAVADHMSAKNVDILYASHDSGCTDGAGILNKTSGLWMTLDNCYVYGVIETDVKNASSAKTAAAAFVTWAESLTDDKAILVLSHYPLHAKRGDNAGAGYWHNALNKVATGSETGGEIVRDVAFFHGHNHTVDTTEYFYAVGESLSIESYVTPSATMAASLELETFTMQVLDPELELQEGMTTNASANGTSATIYYTYATAGYLTENRGNGQAMLVAVDEDTITFTKYKSSSETVLGTVVRKVASTATPSNLIVTGANEYSVGDTYVAPTVSIKYSDGTTQTLTGGYTIEGAPAVDGEGKLTTVGEYTLTYSCTLNGYAATAKFDITVKEAEATVTEQTFAADYMVDVTATATGATANRDIDIVGVNDYLRDGYYFAYDVSVEGQVEGTSVTITFWLEPDMMSLENFALYYVDEDGEFHRITNYITGTEDGVSYVVVSDADLGVYAYGEPVDNVPTEAVLSHLEIAELPQKLNYFINTDAAQDGVLYLDITRLVVNAVYTHEGETYTQPLDWNQFDTEIDGYSLSMDSMTTKGVKTVTVTYGNLEPVTFTVTVYQEYYEDETSGVTVQIQDFYETELTVADNTAADFVVSAMETLEVENYVAYDIDLSVLPEGQKVTVTLPVPTGMTNPGVYYVPADGSAAQPIEGSYDAEAGTVTFETDHFSTWALVELPETETAETVVTNFTTTVTGTKTVYQLVSTPTAGNQYIIVSRGTAGEGYALKENTTTGSSITVNVASGNITAPYVETTDETIMWNATSGVKFQSENGGYYLRYNDGLTFSTSSSTNWTVGTNSAYTYSSSRYRYVYNYNGTWTVYSNRNISSSYNLYFYEETTIPTSETLSGDVTLDAGEDYSVVFDSTDATDVSVTINPTVKLTESDGTVHTPNLGGTYSYAVVKDENGILTTGTVDDGVFTLNAVEGTATIRVYYTWTADGTTYTIYDDVEITTTLPYYTVNITDEEGNIITKVIAKKSVTSDTSVTLDSEIKLFNTTYPEGTTDHGQTVTYNWVSSNTDIATVTNNGDGTATVNFTGTSFGAVNISVYMQVGGEWIYDTVTFTASASNYYSPEDGPENFPEYPNPGSININKTATAVGNFSQTGIAQIELYGNGIPVEGSGPIDVVLVLDASGSMTSTRIAASIAAAKEFAEQICYTNGVANQNRIAIVFFGNSTHYPVSYSDLDNSTTYGYELATASGTWEESKLYSCISGYCGKTSSGALSGGTKYQEALAVADQILKDAKTDGTGDNRSQYLLFMTDGAPTEYDYVTNYEAVQAGTATTYTKASATGQDKNNASATTAGRYEYYTACMKQRGITVYTVGTALTASDNANSVEFLRKMATDDAKAYAVSESDVNSGKLKEAFSTIATEIKAAAKDVTVVDYIAPAYELIFDLPDVHSNGNNDPSIANDFYIEVVNYKLDDNRNRTDEVDNVMRVYLAQDDSGNVSISKVIDGVNETVLTDYTPVYTAVEEGKSGYFNLENGSYVFVADGSGKYNLTGGALVTGNNKDKTMVLATPYFIYDQDTKCFVWTTDELGDKNQIALRYFVYLTGSIEGLETDGVEVPAGPYETNSIAWIAYTNHLDNLCYQYFPVPQLTWNGAQVTYVFYLVNSDGLPVNKAGQVINFTNAVEVTQRFTESVVWNNAEGVASLDVTTVASKVLPEYYTLYSSDARYDIHVYQTETGAAQGTNYFKITDGKAINGDDDGVTTDVDYSTKVFIDKSSTKYDVPGYYTAKGVTVTDVDDNTTHNSTQVFDGFDFGDTTVAFAVMWTPELQSDVVVVDFGLDVVIDVTYNDYFANTVNGIGAAKPGFTENTAVYTPSTFGKQNIDTDNYTASIENGNAVRFHQKTMEFSAPVTFYYDSAVAFTQGGATQTGYMYSSVTVIPATTVYYEDEFVDLTTYTRADSNSEYEETAGWASAVASTGAIVGATQASDRPGTSLISAALDADNNYGYDAAYDTCSMYSMGSAAKISVNANQYGTAQFDFYGTGFDVIALTSNTTGTLIVQVYDESGKVVKTASVDTYYGYTYGIYEVTYTLNKDGKWEQTNVGDAPADVSAVKVYNSKDELTKEKRTENEDGSVTATGYIKVWKAVGTDPNALYQVPVMKISGLTYGKYTAKISALYYSSLDHTSGTDGYDLYLDAIRIYDPAGTNKEANDAYIKDGEGYPVYLEVRNEVILESGAKFEEISLGRYQVTMDQTLDGAIFIDSNPTNTSIAEYIEYGPNNELYLAKGQSVTFNLDLSSFNGTVADVQIGMKLANGSVANYAIWNANDTTDVDRGSLLTATEMYYSIMDKANGTIVIKNNSSEDCILSITNIKLTFTKDPGAVSTADIVYIDGESVTNAVNSLAYVEVSKPTFAPGEMDISFNRTIAEVGNNVVVTVTTSNDVKNLLVNGKVATNKTTSYLSGETTWSFTVPVEDNGSLKVTVVGYDSNGEYTVPYTESVTVINMSGTQEDLLGKLFG